MYKTNRQIVLSPHYHTQQTWSTMLHISNFEQNNNNKNNIKNKKLNKLKKIKK